MYGIQIAFKDFRAIDGIMGSAFASPLLKHFNRLFSYQFKIIISNTFLLSLGNLFLGFPLPIIFALLLNQIKRLKFKKIVQTTTYAPYFLSVVIIVALINVFTQLDNGIINIIFKLLGRPQIHFMGKAEWFRPLYYITEIWQKTGWDSIIYLAALAGVSPELHEAAMMDGASKVKRIIHIDIPGILPTIIILFILRAGQIMRLGFEKVYLMQTSLNLSTSEIISTYVYKIGIKEAQYSFATAVGLFNSVVNFVIIIVVNRIAKAIGETSLW
jgi:putative aldouronate transport system permease protein